MDRENPYSGRGGSPDRAEAASALWKTRPNMQRTSESHFDLRRCVPMSRADEHRCALAYVKTKDPALAERLVVANMRLVVKLAASIAGCRGT